MEREVFKSKSLRGVPIGLISGFMYGCIILVIALALGMDEDMFIPLLGIAVVLGGIIGIIRSTGKRMEADADGVYTKNKEYLFAENDMYMQVHTHYYGCIPVTDRWINVVGMDGKHEVKCSFLGNRDAGRLAKVVEDGMRKKHRTLYDSFEPNSADVRYFSIPAAEMNETIDKRVRLLVRLMFWSLTVLYSWIFISMLINDDLEEHGLGFVGFALLNGLILGGVNFSICKKFKNSARRIPCEVMICEGTMYIDGKSVGGADVSRVVMTPERGSGTGDMRKLVFYESSGNTIQYDFGFRADRNGFPGYGQLVEAVKDNFGDKFAYDIS